MQAMTSQEQHYDIQQEVEAYKDFSKYEDWQILIFIGNKDRGNKTNWDGGAFVIKNHTR